MAFETTTTSFAGPLPKAPPFAWSYSRLKNFRSCAKRHYHYDIAKDIREDKSEALAFGDDVHQALHMRLAKGTPLPAMMYEYEPIVQEFLAGTPSPDTQILVEQKFAITRDFTPTTYFDKKNPPWFRSIADAVKVKTLPDGRQIALNWDWKTGKPKPDPLQILTAATCLLMQYPKMVAVRNAFIWLQDGIKTEVTLKREQLPELWTSIIPEVAIYEEACRTQTFPPKKNGLCREYCGVETCQYHGT